MEKFLFYSFLQLLTTLRRLGLIIILLAANYLAFASPSMIADKIQTKIESNLYAVKPYIQSHYATRMYRLTGNQKYLYPILFNQLAASIQYKNLLRTLKWNSHQVKNVKLDFPKNFKSMTKWDKRRYILNNFPEMKRNLQLIYILSIASQLNLADSSLYPNSTGFIKYLKSNNEQLISFLLSPQFIKYASPNIANHVYNLKEMNIIDLTNEYQTTFQKVFNKQKDGLLSDAEYTEKIYGMTHIIIAASNYYQHEVSKEDFSWIYGYFDSNIDEIISRLKYDVIIEVGLCYLLADNISNQQPIEKIKKYVLAKFDPKKNLVNEPWDNSRIDKAEHRNVLTILFLNWNNNLYPGPDLLNSKPYKELMKPQAPL